MKWSQIWSWVSGQDSSRDLLIAALRGSSEELAENLREEIQVGYNLRRELEISKARQISAEAISSERKAECLRLIEELRLSREALQSALGERLRSLDSLNIRLLSPKSSETPDLAAFKALQEKAYESGASRGASQAVLGAVQSLKSQARSIDKALLETLHPRFKRSTSTSASLELPPDGAA